MGTTLQARTKHINKNYLLKQLILIKWKWIDNMTLIIIGDHTG